MDHWRLAYLGMRQIPQELSEFELATFFTYSPKERSLIDARRSPLYRLAVAVHIGFIRMTGRTLDACKQVPRFLWAHVGAQVGVTPPDMGTLNATLRWAHRYTVKSPDAGLPSPRLQSDG
nr:DUF4158 domain-containing protein [Cupriavidus sp. L7L]